MARLTFISGSIGRQSFIEVDPADRCAVNPISFCRWLLIVASALPRHCNGMVTPSPMASGLYGGDGLQAGTEDRRIAFPGPRVCSPIRIGLKPMGTSHRERVPRGDTLSTGESSWDGLPGHCFPHSSLPRQRSWPRLESQESP